MINYTTSAAVKTYLGITVSTFDTVIGDMVVDADVEINSALDIDGFITGTEKTELIQRQDVVVSGLGYYALYLRNYNVLTVEELNGTAYAGTKGMVNDYYIMNSRKLVIKDLYNDVYETVDKFGAFEITYTYGYAANDIPTDIKHLAKLRVAHAFREKYPTYSMGGEQQAQGLSRYQLGDESISFRDQRQSEDRKEIDRILVRYKKPHVLS